MLVRSTGGAGGYSWSVVSGTLPAGLTLAAGGSISGIPSAAGAFTFTVQAKDAAGATATRALGITINPPALAITTSSLPSGTVGTAYSQTLAATGGTGGYSWSVVSGTLPAGLTLAAGGSISGIPSAAGAFTFTVQAKDAAGATATRALGITINPPALAITTSSLPSGTVGTAYSQTLAATGGTGGYSWSVVSGTLPAGLTLAAGGSISGIPSAAGAFTFTVQAKDAAGATATRALGITINPPALAITTSSLPSGTVGTAFSQTLAATGGAGGYSWSVVSGTLPAGLTLATGGSISGIPSAAGAFTFTVQAKDAAGATATRALGITINPPALAITTSSLPSGTVGTAYSQTLAATGGTGGYSWSVVSGTLPAGLTLAAGGSISGIPSAAGAFTFTVQAKDAAGATATGALGITINPPALAITTSSLPSGTVGTAYSQTLAATGGTGGDSWSVVSGTLPAGLTLAAGGAISGIPSAAGAFTFTVQAKDAAGATATRALGITINPPALAITTSSLPSGTVGTAYSQTLAATGGTGGYSWSVVSGTLPAGLTLAAGGSISGIPSAAGAFTFTVQAKDAAGATATETLGITINPPALAITTSSLPSGTVGAAYSQTLAATGGTGGY